MNSKYKYGDILYCINRSDGEYHYCFDYAIFIVESISEYKGGIVYRGYCLHNFEENGLGLYAAYQVFDDDGNYHFDCTYVKDEPRKGDYMFVTDNINEFKYALWYIYNNLFNTSFVALNSVRDIIYERQVKKDMKELKNKLDC